MNDINESVKNTLDTVFKEVGKKDIDTQVQVLTKSIIHLLDNVLDYNRTKKGNVILDADNSKIRLQITIMKGKE